MTTPTDDRSDQSNVKPSKRRRLVIILLLSTSAVLVGGIGQYAWYRPPIPEPPAVDLAGVDPAIVAAVEQAQAAVRTTPDSPSTWGHLGMILLTHDFTAEARTCFAQAEQLDPREPRWPYYLGIAMRDEDADSAIVHLQRAVSLFDETLLEPRIRLAEELLGQDRFPEAERLFRRVLEHDPYNAFALLGMGRLAARQGRLPEALDYTKRARNADGPRKAIGFLLAEIYQQQGNKTAAAEEFRRATAMRDDPPRPDRFVEEYVQLRTGERAQLKRAQTFLETGRVPQAVTLLQQLVRQYPNSASCWLTLGRALGRQRQWPASEQALKRATQLAPDNSEIQVQLGIALFFEGNANAEAAFHKAIQLQPDCAPAYYNLGLCLIKRRDVTAAIEAFRTAVRLQPDLADAYIGLGSQLVLQGQLPDAIRQLRRAVELHPADPRAQQLLKQALLRIWIPALPCP
ncbi:MAG TPA: tetratricopeptide repeat protein [Gemmataceae bacterium]|nr:tetratricopeptide repeat protein [Gemmataceae bacterium]